MEHQIQRIDAAFETQDMPDLIRGDAGEVDPWTPMFGSTSKSSSSSSTWLNQISPSDANSPTSSPRAFALAEDRTAYSLIKSPPTLTLGEGSGASMRNEWNGPGCSWAVAAASSLMVTSATSALRNS